MTLSPPIVLQPGTCGCSVDGATCACMPADAAELMTRLSEARYRGDEAERTRLAKQLNDAMTYRADDGARKDTMTTPPKDYRLDADERETLIGRTVETMLNAGVRVDEVHDLEAKLRAGSDAYTRARAEGAIAAYEDIARRDAAAREKASIREITQVTAADREQAAVELEIYYSASPWAAPHATRTDENEHVAAVDMRAREIARRRVAREDADARMFATPRKSPSNEPPSDPVLEGVGSWASPPPGRKRGR
jgi:hypothetical protein